MNEQLWKQVLDELQLEISKPRFISFFKNTTLVDLSANVATIGAPNAMTADLLEKNYYALIKKVLDKKTNNNNSLVFSIKTVREKTNTDQGPLFSQKKENTMTKRRPARIREDYTFDSLAVSDTNQLAYTASFAVATDPGGKYNPLFIYGSVGVGKTHLMHAIANMVFEKNNDATILYLTTEEFTNEMVEALQTKSTTKLRKKFRNIDLLLLDDIQFLSGKEKIQEELFHTFNSLVDNHGQVIFSSDRPPHEIKKIENRLASRFEMGLTIDIEPADLELRAAILLIKSKGLGINLTNQLAQKIAQKVTNTRALEGSLLKLKTLMAMEKKGEITDTLVDKSLGHISSERPIIHPDDVIRTVCEYFNIKSTQLKGPRREATLVRARHLCMYLLYTDLKITFVEIGNLLGGRDHTTIMHGVDRIKSQKEKNTLLEDELKQVTEILRQEA